MAHSFTSRLKPAAKKALKIIDPNHNGVRWLRELSRLSAFRRELAYYRSLPNAETIREKDLMPMLLDRTSVTTMDHHYVYQSFWAIEKIRESTANLHVDVGSHSFFVVLLSALKAVTFVDIRPLKVDTPHFYSTSGSLLALPFADQSVASLSCMHVIEHVGLGRYGDPLDPLGSKRACAELARVVAIGGHLYVSTPIGRHRVCFNAHRVHAPQQILDYFGELTLLDFALVDDQGHYHPGVSPEAGNEQYYACGMFHFTRSQ